MKRCLIIDDVHPSLFEYLENVEVYVDYRPDITPTEVFEVIEEYDILVLRSKMNVDAALLDRAERLKIIGRCGAGLDNIDLKYASKKNIQTLSANEGNRDAVAEHVIGMILCLLHRIVKSNLEIQDFIWDREGNRGEELGEKVVGLIGYGNMGKAVAKRLKAFGCEVIAYDKYLDGFSDEYVRQVSMEEIFQKTDILSLHIPLTSETEHLVNEAFFNKFVKQIRLVNSSRGKIVILEDLVKAIESKRVFGVALDVLENERLKSYGSSEIYILNKLISFDNVVITPHVAGWSVESYRKLSEVLGDKIINSLTKK